MFRYLKANIISTMTWLSWLRDPVARMTRCRDENGHRSTVVVRLACGFVTLEGSSFGPVHLSPLQVGRLRAALKSAVLDLDTLLGSAPWDGVILGRSSTSARLGREVPPRTARRPSVAEISARLDNGRDHGGDKRSAGLRSADAA